MNFNTCIELSDDSAQNVSGGYYFGPNSSTTVTENLTIKKYFESKTNIYGNFAGAEADAYASGPNTSTQAVSYTNVIKGVSSASNATSVSGTNGSYWHRG
jgi:hypothetical protein